MSGKKSYTAKEIRNMVERICRIDIMDGLSSCKHNYTLENEAKDMLIQSAEMLERLESCLDKIKKNREKIYRKCKKCPNAINGKPGSFKGEPCYWHIDGCEEMEYAEDEAYDENGKAALLRYVKFGTKKKS